jgi:hypothetical protein
MPDTIIRSNTDVVLIGAGIIVLLWTDAKITTRYYNRDF